MARRRAKRRNENPEPRPYTKAELEFLYGAGIESAKLVYDRARKADGRRFDPSTLPTGIQKALVAAPYLLDPNLDLDALPDDVYEAVEEQRKEIGRERAARHGLEGKVYDSRFDTDSTVTWEETAFDGLNIVQTGPSGEIFFVPYYHESQREVRYGERDDDNYNEGLYYSERSSLLQNHIAGMIQEAFDKWKRGRVSKASLLIIGTVSKNPTGRESEAYQVIKNTFDSGVTGHSGSALGPRIAARFRPSFAPLRRAHLMSKSRGSPLLPKEILTAVFEPLSHGQRALLAMALFARWHRALDPSEICRAWAEGADYSTSRITAVQSLTAAAIWVLANRKQTISTSTIARLLTQQRGLPFDKKYQERIRGEQIALFEVPVDVLWRHLIEQPFDPKNTRLEDISPATLEIYDRFCSEY